MKKTQENIIENEQKLKNSIKSLGRIYIDLDYSKLKTELESYKTLEEIVLVYDSHLEQLANMSGLASKIVSLQNFEKIICIKFCNKKN